MMLFKAWAQTVHLVGHKTRMPECAEESSGISDFKHWKVASQRRYSLISLMISYEVSKVFLIVSQDLIASEQARLKSVIVTVSLNCPRFFFLY